MPATTIDEVIRSLDDVIARSQREGDRLGIFAMLYRRVTLKVKEGICSGRFQDGPRMERLDVVFADRYFEALRQFRLGIPPSRCWLVSFRAAQSSMTSAARHMLLGINAHINLDLGIAAAEILPAEKLPGLKRDFDEINYILAEVFSEVRGEEAASWKNLPARVAPSMSGMVVSSCLARARRHAWGVATRLAALDRAAWESEIRALDRKVAAVGWVIRGPFPGIGNPFAANVRLGDASGS